MFQSVVLLISLIVAGLTWAENPSYKPDPHWKAPVSAAERANPLAGKAALAAGGKKVFMRGCVECHGEDGKGLEKKHSANLHLNVVQDQTDGAMFWKVTNGNPDRGMPSFSKLPEAQRWQLVLYIRTLK